MQLLPAAATVKFMLPISNGHICWNCKLPTTEVCVPGPAL